jgi:hypothetical protein
MKRDIEKCLHICPQTSSVNPVCWINYSNSLAVILLIEERKGYRGVGSERRYLLLLLLLLLLEPG